MTTDKRGNLVLTINEIQTMQSEILKVISDVCESNDITYFLCTGTALGAVRHGGPIPWDNDVDIMIPENQIVMFCKLVESKLNPKYFIDYYKIGNTSKMNFPRIGLKGYSTHSFHADIFRLVGMPDDVYKQKIMILLGRILHKLIRIHTGIGSNSLKRIIVKVLKLFIPINSFLEKYDILCNKYPFEDARYASILLYPYGQKNTFSRDMFSNYIMVKYEGIDMRVVEDYSNYLKQLYGDYMKFPPKKEREKALNREYIIQKIES